MTSRISDALRAAEQENRAAFIPYLTAGDPSLDWTGNYLKLLEEAGADVVELGVPFSDPMADGPVNQRAAERALASGTTLRGILALVRKRRDAGFSLPVVLFTYLNPVLRMGIPEFASAAAAAGVDGVLALDLPPEEAGDYRRELAAAGLDAVFLAAPTSNEARLRLIDEASSGFVYYVSRLGVTGARERLSETLAADMERVRRVVRNRVALGFGIATPEAARTAAGLADAVVVGSALVRFIEGQDPEEAGRKMAALAREIAEALRRCQ